MPLPQRDLGRTGHRSPTLAFGAFALSALEQRAADAVVDDALQRGVNHFDVAPSYGDAELKLAPSVARHRDRMFLACKTRERRKNAAREEMERSLERLGTDHFDLYQCHGVSDAVDLEQILGPGGAIEAFQEARTAGLTRFLGITGHHCAILKQAIERYPFDTVTFPLNPIQAADPRPVTDFGPLLRAAVDRGMGVIAIKSMALGPWPNGSTPSYGTWYRPHDDPEKIEERLRFTLTHPVTSAVLPGDVRLWPAIFDAAERFEPLSDAAIRAMISQATGSDPIYVDSVRLAFRAY